MGTDAHVCLLLFSSLIALTAEAYPARYRIMPSPIQRYRPTGFTYPHRKLSRPWLVKLQEELWKDGPSGDGPEEDGRSSLISPTASQINEASTSDYKTHSPSAEDFFSHQTEPFPTIIDTMMDESSSFEDEFVSRTSLLYEGPSSLLNSFIFRPNLPYSPLSSIKTPMIEESSDFLNVIPSWMDESTGSRIMSPRQALSETVFNEFFLITAISATHIESETAQTLLANVSFHRLPSGLSTNFTAEESPRESKNLVEVASSSSRISTIRTSSAYSDESNVYTEKTVSLTSYQFTDPHFTETIRPNLASQMFLSSDIPVSLLESRFYSNVLTEMPYISTFSHSRVFYQTLDLPSPAHSSEITDLYFGRTNTLDNSFSTEILYNPDGTFYTQMSFKSLLSRNVQTVVTVVEDESKSNIFTTPVSRNYEIPTTHSLFSVDVQNINPSVKHSKFENIISSISASFNDFNEVVPVVSLLPVENITTVENIISREDTATYLKTISHFDRPEEPHSASDFDRSHSMLSSIRTFLLNSEIAFNKRNSLEEFKPFVSDEISELLTYITPPISFVLSYDVSDTISKEQTFTHTETESNTLIFDRESKINEIKSDRIREGTILTSLNLLTSSQIFDALTVFNSIPYETIPWVVYSTKSFSEILSPTRTQSYSQHLEMTTTTAFIPNIMSTNDISEEKDILSRFSTEFIDPSAHHVTARSLNEHSFTDIKESISLLIDFSTTDTDTDSTIITFENNLTPVPNSTNEEKSEKMTLTSYNLRSTMQFDEDFKVIESAASFISRTMTTPEFSSCCCFESSMLFKNSEIHPSLDVLFSDKITPTNSFGSQTLEDEIYKEVLESSLNASDTKSESSTALSDSVDKSMKDTDIHESIQTVFMLSNETSENKYTRTSVKFLDGQTIEPSLVFPHFSPFIEPNITAFSNSLSTDIYAHLSTSRVQEKSSDEYLISSSTDYLNEDLLHSSDRALTKHLSSDEAYSNAEHNTRTISFKTSKETASTAIAVDSTDLIIDQNNIRLKSNDISASPILSPYSVLKDSTSEIFDFGHAKNLETQSSISYEDNILQLSHSEISSGASDFRHLDGSVKTDFLYDFYSESPILSVHYRSTLDNVFDTNDVSATLFTSMTQTLAEISYFPIMLTSHSERFEYTSPTLETILYPDMPLSLQESASSVTRVLEAEDKLDFSGINRLSQINTVKQKSSLMHDLYSETISIMFDSPFAVISSFISDKESNLYRPMDQKTSGQSATAWTKATLIDIPSRHIESSIDYASTLSAVEKSEFDLHTSDFSSFNVVPSEGGSKYLEMSRDFIDKFTLVTESTSYDHIRYQIDSSEKSIQDDDLLLATKTVPLSSAFPFSGFTSKADSMFFSGPEITPSKTLGLEETVLTTEKLTKGELYSKLYSDDLKSFTYSSAKLNFEHDTAFYQHTPELTPSLLTTAFEQSGCEFLTCPTEPILETSTPDISLLKSDFKFLISPTMLSDSVSEEKEHVTSLGSISLSFPWHMTITKLETYDSQRVTESKSIKLDSTVRKPDSKTKDSDYPYKPTIQYSSRQPDLKTMDSDNLIKITPTTPLIVTTPVDHYSVSRLTSEGVEMMKSSPVYGKNNTLSAHPKQSSTPGYDIEMASVLAISSFFGANSSRNASSGFENSGISEEDWSKSEVKPTPSLDLTLFRDNNYWILTVLETPIKGHLPENYSHTLEVRLANAYSEAFRQRHPKQEGSSEPIIVKILSLTNDLLLSQLNVVYVVEKGGILLPAEIAADLFNFLRHEQLREFLGLYAILKAKPYRPDELPETKAISSTIPVVTIVCSILGFLLLIFCCFCVYCRCCRPKQESDASPTSSASGSLQRSLAKHGQHNRKHLFQEMAHHLTTEIVAVHRKIESPAKDLYLPEKEPPPPGKKLPPLPATEQAEAIDKAARMLKILENKDATTSPITQKRSRDKNELLPDEASTLECKKTLPKPKKRKKPKEVEEKKSTKSIKKSDKRDARPPSHIAKKEKQASATEENRKSPDSGTSSRHTSSSQASAPEKMSEEAGSDGSNTELLPPVRDLIAKSKAESEAAVADTQDHLSRVRQRISEILDDAFALANGRKFYGSMRSKKINPATETFPRHGSLRSQSAAECSLSRHEESPEDEKRRPISEGAQNLLGAITDDGQLITRAPPKSVWDHAEYEDSISDVTKHPEVTEAHNRHVNFFPFQQQSKQQQTSSSSMSSSLPTSDMQRKLPADMTNSTISVLREVASEIYPAHSSKIHPAVIDQYDETDLVSELKEDEPVVELIQAIKDELQKFSGSMHGIHNNESNA